MSEGDRKVHSVSLHYVGLVSCGEIILYFEQITKSTIYFTPAQQKKKKKQGGDANLF